MIIQKQKEYIQNPLIWLKNKKHNLFSILKDMILLNRKTKMIFIIYVLCTILLIFLNNVVNKIVIDKIKEYLGGEKDTTDRFTYQNHNIKYLVIAFILSIIIHGARDIIAQQIIKKLLYKKYHQIMHNTILNIMNKIHISDIANIKVYKTFNTHLLINKSLNILENIVSIISAVCTIIYYLYIISEVFSIGYIALICLFMILQFCAIIGIVLIYKKQYEKLNILYDKLHDVKENLLDNYYTISIYNKFQLFKNKFIKETNNTNQLSSHITDIQTLCVFLMMLFTHLCFFIIFILPVKSMQIMYDNFENIFNMFFTLHDITSSAQKLYQNIYEENLAIETLNTVISAYYKPQPNVYLNSDIETIEIKDFDYIIHGNPILSNVNLKINKGERVLFFGPSGCGKTTLMKCILGYLKPTKGEILVNNINSNTLNITDYLSHLSIIEQENSIFNDTIFNNLGIYTVEKEKVQDICNKVNFDLDLNRQALGTLSGGQKRRVCLLRGLLMYKQNNLVLIDEAFANLNQLNILKNINLIQEYINKDSIMIFIEHSLELLPYIDKVCVFMLNEDNTYTTQMMNVQEFKTYINQQML